MLDSVEIKWDTNSGIFYRRIWKVIRQEFIPNFLTFMGNQMQFLWIQNPKLFIPFYQDLWVPLAGNL